MLLSQSLCNTTSTLTQKNNVHETVVILRKFIKKVKKRIQYRKRVTMDKYKLRFEQKRLATKRITLPCKLIPNMIIAGALCQPTGKNGKDIIATIVTCTYPSFEILEKAQYILNDATPYHPEFIGDREMPALIEAFNKLNQDPDLIIMKGDGINHPSHCGVGVYVGITIKKPVIAISENNTYGTIDNDDVILNETTVATIIQTKEHAIPIIASPGNGIDIESIKTIIPQLIKPPHKLPEPLHLASRLAKKQKTIAAKEDSKMKKEKAPGENYN